jgi:serine/threonine-protein kinase
MAPEQLTGGEVGIPADVYGLGGILYLLVAGRPAFPDASARRADPRLSPPPLLQVAPDTAKALSAIAAKALAGHEAHRYGSARELADDVSRFLDGLPVSAYEENLLEKAYRVVDRNRAAFALVGVYLFVRTLLLLLRLG